ncbi:MAG TPA: amidase, partial [Sorangium sp.]|nr:amidase [Sorangium sp.]
VTEPDIHPPTRNPWNSAFSAGGSSGGSGAAVAAGLLPLAHGSDGAGSVRIPAAFCHLFGFKPSRTLLGNLHGPVNKLGLSVMGPLTHTVRDAAAMLDVMAALKPSDEDDSLLLACQQPVRPLRILFCNVSPLGRNNDTITAAAASFADRLANLGHRIEAVAPPEGSVDEFLPLWQQQMASVPVLREHWLQPTTRYLRNSGATLSLGHVLALHRRLARRVEAFFGEADMLLTPTVPILPPRVGEFAALEAAARFRAAAHCGAFTALFNISGQPAATLPAGLAAPSLPFGVQLVGRYGADAEVLRLCRQLEQDAPWDVRHPSAFWPHHDAD